MNPGDPFASISIYNLKKKNIINAVVKKRKAPVKELKSFYYYDILFPEINDSFSVYFHKGAFSLELTQIIEDYQLIENDELNKVGVANFKKQYSQLELSNKINEMKEYLNDTRNYYMQVERDRTQPIYILNEKVIYHDSVVISYVFKSSIPYYSKGLTVRGITTQGSQGQNYSYEIRLEDGTLIRKELYGGNNSLDLGYTLYMKSIPSKLDKNKPIYGLLFLACYLVENYTL